MVKGLKQTSSLIQISAGITESAANTFTTQRVDLQLNPLDNEVFVVQAIDLDLEAPDLAAATVSRTTMTVSATARTTTGGIDADNVLAAKRIETQEAGGAAVTNEYAAIDSPPTALEYIAILSTNDYFINIEGLANANAKGGNVRVYGYRAKADASVYAALVQSEVLSA